MSKLSRKVQITNLLKDFPVYAFLAAAWILLILQNYNRIEIEATAFLTPLLWCLPFIWLTLYIIRRYEKSYVKAGLPTLFLVLVFFTFSFVQNALNKFLPFLGFLWSDGILILLVVLAAIIGSRWLRKQKGNLSRLNLILNVVFSFLVAFNLIKVIGYYAANPSHSGYGANDPVLNLTKPGNSPDIYYFVMDRYPSQASLKANYNYDNKDFLSFLNKKGFVVPSNAHSNYQFTAPSLASTFNMRYLDKERELNGKTDSLQPLYQLVENSQLVKSLKKIDYQYIHVASRWGPTRQNDNADISYDDAIGYTLFGKKFVPSEFNSLIIRGSLISALFENNLRLGSFTVFGTPDNTPQYSSVSLDGLHAKSFNYQVEVLTKDVHKHKGPKFVFSHMLMPHEPYVFMPDGSQADYAKDVPRQQKLVNQLEYGNSQLKLIIDKIMRESNNQAIIVIQADEGPYPLENSVWSKPDFNWLNIDDKQLQEKMGIMAAFYLPDRASRKALNPDITPVNSWRIILNQYFGTGLELLPNKHFLYANENERFNWQDITKRIEAIKKQTL